MAIGLDLDQYQLRNRVLLVFLGAMVDRAESVGPGLLSGRIQPHSP